MQTIEKLASKKIGGQLNKKKIFSRKAKNYIGTHKIKPIGVQLRGKQHLKPAAIKSIS